MVSTFQSTELDFENIKSNLKKYLEDKPEFADYNWDASGLNNILDVLAYNTHFNALFANFALNEAYLSSAQLRSSIITLAQSLGYSIRSRTASRADVKLSLNLSTASVKPASITLPSGTTFTTSVDGISYTFQTRESYTAINDSDIYTFVTSDGSTSIPIYEGTLKTKTFIVQESDERQVFIIPDETIDTKHVTVKVYDTYTSTNYDVYTDIDDALTISPTSKHYRILETPNGNYELSFGDGKTTGMKPAVGNKVVVEYLSVVGPLANTASSFTPTSTVTVNGTDYTLSTTTVANSYSGAYRQSIESIRANAPLTFASQKRLVTTDDYKTTILSKFSNIIDVAVWGGEDHQPPNYGIVYISILFNSGVSSASQDTIKANIKNDLNENLGVLAIDVDFIDPTITYLEITTNFIYNKDLTSLSRNALERQVSSAVEDYINTNLKSFNGIFRKSNLLANIDNLNEAILSSEISVKLQQRFSPIEGISDTYILYFPVPLKDPDDVNYIITSSQFEYQNKIVRIQNLLSSNKLQIVDLDNNVVVDNVGSYEPTTGKVMLEGFNPQQYHTYSTTDPASLKIIALPLNDNNIKPLRNYYFDIDINSLVAIGNNVSGIKVKL